MKNPFLAEEISFYGAAEGNASANFYAAATAESANPYAVLALFDANFATFGADYAEALAAINAAIADLSGAIAKLDAAKGDKTKLADVQKTVTNGALARAESTTQFATNVAEREKAVNDAAKTAADALGTSVSGLAGAVASKLGISVAEVQNLSADVSNLAAASAKLQKSANIDAVAISTLKSAALAEVNSATDTKTAGLKAAAVLAKKAAIAQVKADEAERSKSISDAALKQLKDDAAAAVEAQSTASELAAKMAAEAKDIATGAKNANDTAKELKKLDDAALSEKVNEAKNAAAKKAAEEAAKAEAAKANADKYALSVKMAADDEVSVIFADVEKFVAFKGEKTADAVADAIKALALNKLADNGIVGMDEWSFAASGDAVRAKWADEIDLTFASDVKLSEFAATTKKFDEGITAAELITNGKVSKIGAFAVKIGSGDDSNKIIVTLKEGVDVTFEPHDTKHAFTEEMIKELAVINANTNDIKYLQPTAVNGMEFDQMVGETYVPVSVKGVSLLFNAMNKQWTFAKLAKLAGAADEAAAKTAAKEIGALEVISLDAIAQTAPDDQAVSEIGKFADLKDGMAAVVSQAGVPNGAKLGHLIKTAAGLDWAPKGAKFIIKNISADAKQDKFVNANKDLDIAKIKDILASTAKSVKISGEINGAPGELEFSLGAKDASSVVVAGAKLTLADSAKIGDIAALKTDANVCEAQAAGVNKIGENVFIGDDHTNGTVVHIGAANGAKITFGASPKLAAIKALSNDSTGAQLLAAGVTQIGDVKLSDEDVAAVTIGSKKYNVNDAKLSDIVAFAKDQSTAKDGIIELKDITIDLKANGDAKAADSIASVLSSKAAEIKPGEVVVIKDSSAGDNGTTYGNMAKNPDGSWDWATSDGVEISKINTEKTLADLIKIASKDASINDAYAVAAKGVLVDVKGTIIPATLGDKAFAASAKISDYLNYLDAKNITNVAKLVGLDTPASKTIANLADKYTVGLDAITLIDGVTLANTKIDDSGAWVISSDTYGKVTGVKDSVKLAENVTASTGWDTLKGYLNDGAVLEKAGVKLTYKQADGSLNIGELKVGTDSLTLGGLAAIAANAGAGSYSYDFDSAIKSLDLSTLAGSSQIVVSPAKASLKASETAKYEFILNKDANYTINLPELKGSGKHDIIELKFTGYSGEGWVEAPRDHLGLNFGYVEMEKLSKAGTVKVGSNDVSYEDKIFSQLNLGSLKATDENIKAVAKVLDSSETVGAAGRTYWAIGDEKETIYIINVGESYSSTKDSPDNSDAVIVKLIGADITEILEAL